MPSISVTNPDKVTILNFGATTPKIGGKVNLDKFVALQEFNANDLGIVSLTGTENISTLTKLSANRNLISHDIPSFAANTALTELNLYLNSFSGSLVFPASGNTLQKCEIFRNQLSGSIPAIPSSLEVLRLNENSLTGSIPTLNTATGLTKVVLNQNILTGSIPALPASLIELKLHQNNLTGALPALPTTIQKVNLSKNAFGSSASSSHNGVLESLADKTALAEFEIYTQSNDFGASRNNASGADQWNGPRTVEIITGTVDGAVSNSSQIVFDAFTTGTLKVGMIAHTENSSGVITNGIATLRKIQSIALNTPSTGHTTVQLDGDISAALPDNSKVVFTFNINDKMRVFKVHECDFDKTSKGKLLAALYTGLNGLGAGAAKTVAVNGITYNGTSGPSPTITMYNNTGSSEATVTATTDSASNTFDAMPFTANKIRLVQSSSSNPNKKLEVGMHVTGTGIADNTYIHSIANNQKNITLTQNVSNTISSAGTITFTKVLRRFYGDNVTFAVAKSALTTPLFTVQGI